MKETICEILAVPFGEELKNFKVPILEYESIEEGDTHAKRAGAMLDQANLNMKYRGPYADARRLIAKCVEEITGEKLRMREDSKNKDGTPIMVPDETEKNFVRRVLGDNPDLFEKVQSLVEQRARGYKSTDESGKETEIPALTADITEKEHVSKVKKLAQKYIDQAKAFLIGALNPKTGKQFNIEKFLAAIKRDLSAEFSRTGDDEKDATTLGWLCKRFADHQADLAASKF